MLTITQDIVIIVTCVLLARFSSGSCNEFGQLRTVDSTTTLSAGRSAYWARPMR